MNAAHTAGSGHADQHPDELRRVHADGQFNPVGGAVAMAVAHAAGR